MAQKNRFRVEVCSKRKGQEGVIYKNIYLPDMISDEEAENIRVTELEKTRQKFADDKGLKFIAEICGMRKTD